MIDETRLRRTLGDPSLGWLAERIRKRMSREEPLVGAITRSNATTAEREAVGRLFGRPVRAGRSASVSLGALDELLRSSGIATGGLEEAVVALHGPVEVRADAIAIREREWAAAHEPLRALAAQSPRWASWVDRAEGIGTLRRLGGEASEARSIAVDASLVLEQLPAEGLSLPILANTALGDAHALDAGRPVAALVLAAVRFLGTESDAAPTRNRRELWESVGVALDELSSTVLVHSLPYSTGTSEGQAMVAVASAGLPHFLTLQQVSHLNLFGDLAGVEVLVCENPSVLASAAHAHGDRCLPIICVRGQPSAAAIRLLKQLTSRGARIRYHGDFDWGGIRIANGLFQRFGFTPWRYSTADYLELAEQPHSVLSGTPVTALWDAALSTAMTEHGVKVEEEAVVGQLAADARGA